LANLTSTADSVVGLLLSALKKEFPSSIEILALGKWGGGELGFRSDLDFIFVLTEEATDNDFKVAKRFISRLTEPHRGGSIYSIDMRLRPSGKAGPLVIPLKDLETYLREEAQPWERQAYLKARWVNFAGPNLAQNYILHGLTAEQLQELERIRQELITKSTERDLKYSEGGMVDVEFAVQSALLAQKRSPPGTSTVDFLNAFAQENHTLVTNYNRLRQIEQTQQLIASESLSEVAANHESFQALALALHTSPTKLLEEISDLFAANIATLKELDPRRGPH
jgi:glutamate-ammonia-ligase adenylyltransferase